MRHTVLLAVILGDLGPEQKHGERDGWESFSPLSAYADCCYVFQEESFLSPPLLQDYLPRSICMSTPRSSTRILLRLYAILKRVAFSTGLPNPLCPIKNLRKIKLNSGSSLLAYLLTQLQYQRQITLRFVGYHFTSQLTATIILCLIHLKLLVNVL